MTINAGSAVCHLDVGVEGGGPDWAGVTFYSILVIDEGGGAAKEPVSRVQALDWVP